MSIECTGREWRVVIQNKDPYSGKVEIYTESLSHEPTSSELDKLEYYVDSLYGNSASQVINLFSVPEG